jgi:hypothetical protein
MSLAELKSEVDRLSPQERRQLRVYLALKDDISDGALLAQLTEKINDRRPERWLTLEAFEKQVGG